MATIKSYTDIEQSRKLAEILTLETADMCWTKHIDNGDVTSLHATVNYGIVTIDYPCWSLIALLNVLKLYLERLEIHLRVNNKYNVFAVKGDFVFRSFDEFPDGIDNLIDCCYKLILKLKELNLL